MLLALLISAPICPAINLLGSSQAREEVVVDSFGSMQRNFTISTPWPEDNPQHSEVMDMAEGVGSMTYNVYPTQNRAMNAQMRRRMVAQDFVALALLLIAFGLTVAASLYSIYHVSADPSAVKYYSDAKGMQERLLCPSQDAEAFLHTFSTSPATARLRIVGFLGRVDSDSSALGLLSRGHLTEAVAMLCSRVRRLGRTVAFDVSLDLTPFIHGEGRLVSAKDEMALMRHLESENPLEVLCLRKHVDWDAWSDVAMNIKLRLRALGFTGDMRVSFECVEDLMVYRNDPWQNFTRNPITTALMGISVIGLAAWLPYTMWRKRVVKVETRFKINVDPCRYWGLINERLSSIEGFEGARWGMMPPARFR